MFTIRRVTAIPLAVRQSLVTGQIDLYWEYTGTAWLTYMGNETGIPDQQEQWQAVHDAEIKLGDTVSVHGLGAIGLMTIQMCRLEGIQNVYAIDPDPHRRELATKFGASAAINMKIVVANVR